MYLVILLLSPLSCLMAVLIGMRTYRSHSTEMKILVLYMGFALIAEITMAVLGVLNVRNLWVFHSFTIIEYAVLIYVFSSWQRSLCLRKALIASIPFFFLIEIGAILFFEDIRQFNSYSRSLEGIIFVGVAAYTLLEVNREVLESPFKDPRFWVGTAVLLYFTGTIIFFAVSNLLLRVTVQTGKLVWLIPTFFNVISYLLYARSFACSYQRRKS